MGEGNELEDLPGWELVRAGVADAHAGRWTVEALTVSTARSRLSALGLPWNVDVTPDDSELALYARLGADGSDDPYGRYNSLLRELDSFIEALESRRRRGAA